MTEKALKLIEKEKVERTGKLDLSFCEITSLPKELLKLTWLESLDLRSNQISDISFLEKLTSLQSLDLSDNQISDYSFLEKLTSLQSLDLRFNQISDYSFLEKLTSLQSLDLRFNQISDISFLEKLTSLQSLDLRSNQISDISFSEKLTSLQSLDLSDNQISDISFLEKLTLDLSDNQISDYSFLEKLTSLQSLYLSDNQISDISFLEKLTSLQSLDLSDNQISDISFLEKLTSLQSLDLSSNQISDIAPLLNILKNGLSISLEWGGGGGIVIGKNPLINPTESIVEKGREEVINWLEQIKDQGSENLYEARIIIAGESKAGKTTLFRKLFDKNIVVPDPKQKATHGININYNRKFQHRTMDSKIIYANVWDFGGQDIQSYLHQYFFTQDNLFILVCDHRKEDTRFDYWFEIISRLCLDSRVIVVRNKKDRETASQDIKIDEYENRFKGLKITSCDVDFKVNDAAWNLLVQRVEESLSVLKSVNKPVPKLWKPVRIAIQKLKVSGRKHIGYGEFQKICVDYGLLKEDNQKLCIQYLHGLGYALHYDESGLANTIFIDPQWITTGLYEVLKEDNYEKSNIGRFYKNEIFEIWKSKGYEPEERNLLLDLLLKNQFDLCYQVDSTEKYLVPLLIKNNPQNPKIKEQKPYIVRYKFPFMPFGFLSRLIVRLFTEIWDNYVWLTGVWLKQNDGYARVIYYRDVGSEGTGDNIIEVAIYGERKDRISILSSIRREIEVIKNNSFKSLAIIEQISCTCSKCELKDTPYFHNRNDLERMMKNEWFKSQCKNSGDLIPSSDLLLSIIDQKALEEQIIKRLGKMEKEKININLSNFGNPVTIQKLQVEQKQATTLKIVSEIKGGIETLREDLEDKRELLLKKLDEDDLDDVLIDVKNSEKAITEIVEAGKNSEEPTPKSKSRIKRFMNDLADEESSIYKTLKVLRKGRDYGVSIAEAYNKVAENIGMPSVPPIGLEVIKKL